MSTTAPVKPSRRSRPLPPPAPAPGRRPWSLSKTAVNGALVLATVYTLFPLLWLLTAAAKNTGDLLGGRTLTPARWNLGDNLGRLAETGDGVYFRWYLNSLLYAGFGALLCALVCVAAGYAFHVYDFPGKEKLFGLVLLGVLVPTTALALPMYLLASELDVVNTYWAVLVPSLVNPFGVYLARVFCAGYVPGEVLEAARMDGASELRTFWSIGLRMVMPGFVTVFLFQFTAIWNNFFLPLVMLSDTKLFPVSLGLYSWNTQTRSFPEYYPLVVTGSLLAVVPLVVAFLALQRFWKAGLTAGSVK
ncbi:ABC transporter, permease [Streptomyces albus]|uniref:ABC transporter, permease n=1 Tax=Streptomyces albus (strain ATCC 21838 / DSM 41398 / FERM P-419 / JCM 4703 / NBRC 107858) TaxID=1081613 RepID=A0A0B5ETD0_STRA4|nr:ABC transporter, permease [Streptomyces albus]AOU75668.1 ABC transporter, permease [Streptomyces albus]AYN31470.1 carbohydrate ABC transporter permease [Streptomyces albus]